jgi:hypothetical protein
MGKKKNKLTEVIRWDSGNHCSFHGTTILATPQSLIDLADSRNIHYESQNDGNDKTNFDFDFQYGKKLQFTVYDWKEYHVLNLDRYYEFHIGGYNGEDTEKGKDILNKLLK